MAIRIGLVGLPTAGKTTVLRLLSQAAGTAGRAGAEAPVAAVKVPDSRLDFLAGLFKPKKVTPVLVEIVDCPSLVRGGVKAAAILSQPRLMDALVAVVRAFPDDRLPHPDGTVDPLRDVTTIGVQLLLADLDVADKRIGRIEDNLRKGKREDNPRELELLRRCHEALEAEQPLRALSFSREEERLLHGFQFLTAKPLLILLNRADDPEPGLLERARNSLPPRTAALDIPARTERDLLEMPLADAEAFRRDLGIGEPGAGRILQACYALLDLITFFTVVGEELRAWTIPRGTPAVQAAGTIHTDMEQGFIRAEVIGVADLQASGSLAAARNGGLLRLEGKDYQVQDGDILTIRFNV